MFYEHTVEIDYNRTTMVKLLEIQIQEKQGHEAQTKIRISPVYWKTLI